MNIPTLSLQSLRRSLSARLLLLTIIFVMIGEVLIYVPSVARFRISYLEDRIAAARLAALSFELLPARAITDESHRKLLSQSKSYNIVLRLPKRSIFVSGLAQVPPVTESFDIRDPSFIALMADAARTLAQKGNRVIRIIGTAPDAPDVSVEVMLDERPLREAM